MADIRGINGLNDDSDLSDSEYTPLYDDPDDLNQRTAQETKGWNLFREIPMKQESGSMVTTEWVDTSVKLLKIMAYIIVFILVLGSAMIAKLTLLFITSQLKKGREVQHCNRILALDQQFMTVLSLPERVTWLWAAWIVFSIPELGIFLRAARKCFFKTIQKPTKKLLFVVLVLETLNTIGIAMLVLFVLPDLDVLKGIMLMNALCIVPGILNLFTRDTMESRYPLKLIFDVLAVSAQATALVVFPLNSGNNTNIWCVPFACFFVSLGWWENYIIYVDKKSSFIIVFLNDCRENLKKTRYQTQLLVSIWKIIVFMICILVSLHVQGDDPSSFFTAMREGFSERTYIAQEVQILIENVYDGVFDFAPTGKVFEIEASSFSSLWVALIQVCSAYLCYICSKFACKILIQQFSFTFALGLVGPVTINALIIVSGLRSADPCVYHETIPDYLFYYMPPVFNLWRYIVQDYIWVWLFWMASQAYITMHTWQPRCERLASTDKLFRKPLYCGVLIDQSLLLNRTNDDENDVTLVDIKDVDEEDDVSLQSIDKYDDVKPSDSISRIYVCATMWHETRDEMMEFLKSIFRLDEDQCARRVAQKYLGIVDPDYYELETHIFMDDAFEISDHSTEDFQVNRFVKCLVDTIDDAASEVHLTNVRLRAPKKYPTPYGGRLVWTLPGKTKMICHLKDKAKIRHRKRWSQVMYMYYFLGHRLMDLPISVPRKEVMAENTYLLALDGDIDFKPIAVTLLVDLMKKNRNLGAACGRIHPVGSGFMAWYQVFEYAIGHWLQKATEHMIGCVLCSPGCFSLFRGKALMDDNVMRKYTLTSNEARHYVQYDQGEDRWLCTLLLQRGYRVEYSAASDAYTHCPEHFDEFFNQRRRWVPSTMANIFDLLADYKRTVKVNDNLSTLYVIYQMVLMVGSILGPGTIFLMLVGALNAITGMSMYNALIWNLTPISIFIIVCLTCKSETQLFIAQLITCLYALLMMVVIIGIILQIIEDGWLAPSSIFTVITFGTFFITAALHPQEMYCILYLFIYYITIPSMYMLLMVYSLCNLNNVSWGTREIAQKKSAKEMELEQKALEEAKKTAQNQSLMKWLGKSEDENGSMECGVAGLFRCMCCTNPNDHKDDMHLLQINHSLEKLDKRLEALGAPEEKVEPSLRRRSSIGLRRESLHVLQEYAESEDSTSDIPREERDDLINPYWIEDPNMEKGEVDFLTTAETEFWKDLIDSYLRPIDENKEELERIKTDLKNLRNLMVFAFLMLNTIFVLVVFMLQLNQDQLHFKWPLGQEVQIAYDEEHNYVIITRDLLQLEPIGTLFIVFFGTVMVLQFSAMLFHRFGTLMHLLSTVQLNFYCTKRPEEMSQNSLLEKNAIEIVKDLQKLNNDDEKVNGKESSDVTRRKTIQNLVKGRESKAVSNLDSNFKRRLTILQTSDKPSMLARMSSLGGTEATRRATLRAIQNRRDSVKATRRSQNLMFDETLEEGRPSTSAYINKGYEPNLDSDSESITTPMPKRSVVRFRETHT